VATGSHAVSVPGPRPSETVLIVEDETEIREMMRDVLDLHGYTVVLARHGGDAVSASDAHPGDIDLMILDLRMPGMSTAEVIGRVRQARPGIKLLYISGYPREEIVRQRGGLPAPGAFLQKPFSVSDLADLVRRVLDTPGPG
ncbi:MAG: response regulator, partial [Candidatus Rokuibacteriota bacterium]